MSGLIVRSHEATGEETSVFPSCSCESSDGLCPAYRREYIRVSEFMSLRVLSCGVCGGWDFLKYTPFDEQREWEAEQAKRVKGDKA